MQFQICWWSSLCFCTEFRLFRFFVFFSFLSRSVAFWLGGSNKKWFNRTRIATGNHIYRKAKWSCEILILQWKLSWMMSYLRIYDFFLHCQSNYHGEQGECMSTWQQGASRQCQCRLYSEPNYLKCKSFWVVAKGWCILRHGWFCH